MTAFNGYHINIHPHEDFCKCVEYEDLQFSPVFQAGDRRINIGIHA